MGGNDRNQAEAQHKRTYYTFVTPHTRDPPTIPCPYLQKSQCARRRGAPCRQHTPASRRQQRSRRWRERPFFLPVRHLFTEPEEGLSRRELPRPTRTKKKQEKHQPESKLPPSTAVCMHRAAGEGKAGGQGGNPAYSPHSRRKTNVGRRKNGLIIEDQIDLQTNTSRDAPSHSHPLPFVSWFHATGTNTISSRIKPASSRVHHIGSDATQSLQ